MGTLIACDGQHARPCGGALDRMLGRVDLRRYRVAISSDLQGERVTGKRGRRRALAWAQAEAAAVRGIAVVARRGSEERTRVIAPFDARPPAQRNGH